MTNCIKRTKAQGTVTEILIVDHLDTSWYHVIHKEPFEEVVSRDLVGMGSFLKKNSTESLYNSDCLIFQ